MSKIETWKRLGRRSLALLLVLIMSLSLCQIGVFAEEMRGMDEEYDLELPLYYDVDAEGNLIPFELPVEEFTLSFVYEEILEEYPDALNGVWSSSDPAIVSFDEDGMVRTHGEGLATISYTFEQPAGEEPEFVLEPVEISRPDTEPAEAEQPAEEPDAEPAETEQPAEEPDAEPVETEQPAEEPDAEPVETEQPAEEPDAESVETPDEPQQPSADMSAESGQELEEASAPEAADEPGAEDEIGEFREIRGTETITWEWVVRVTDNEDQFNLLAAGAIYCDNTDISNETHFARSDGNHTITVNGTWNGTLEFGGNYTVTIKGNGTIDASGLNRSAITVKDGCTVILEGNVTIKGGTGTNVKWDEIVERSKTNGEPAGGGVLVESGATFTMNSGTITGNSATWGGGIAVARGGYLNIYGGSITSNTANSTGNDTLSGAAAGKYGGGGGIFCAGTGLINPANGSISIIGNTTGTVNDLGGGGIFIESKGTMKIYNAIITGNTASGQGGGVAGCLHGKVSNLSPQTAAIYANTAKGNAVVSRLDAIDHHSWWNEKLNSYSDASDYFCAGYSVIGSVSMNGGTTNWTGWKATSAASGVSAATGDPIVVQGVVGLSAGTNGDVKDKADAFAAVHNVVTISGNISSMHGGGIGCNGTLSFGEESFSYSTTYITIKASKNVIGSNADSAKNGYTFQLFKGSDLLATTTSDADGNITFDKLSTFVLFGDAKTAGEVSATLTLKEVAGNKIGMTYDTAPRTISIKAVREDNPVGNVSTGSGGIDVTTHVFTDTLSSATVSQGTATVSSNTVTLSGDANFTNKMEYGKLTVSKTLTDMSVKNDDEFTFTVTIGDEKKTFTLKAGETWTSDEYPVGTKYSVSEQSKDGYTYQSGAVTNETITVGNNPVTITNKRNVQSLTVKKTVTVNDPSSETPNKDDQFTIKVTLGDGTDTTDRGTTTTYAGLGVYTFNLKAGETATITGIPTGTQYLVTEGGMPKLEYTNTNKEELDNRTSLTTDTTVEVINHYYKAKYTDVSVTKSWKGGENYRPESITVELVGGPTTLTNRTAILNADNNWTAGWKNLPEYSGDGGTAYTYTVKEVSVNYTDDSGYTADTRNGNIIRVRSDVEAADGSGNEIVGGWAVNDGSGMSLTNTWRPATELGSTSFTVLKKDSETNEPIYGVTFTLTKDGKQVDEQTTDADGRAAFEGLTDGTYTLTETAVAEGYRTDDASQNLTREWVIDIVKDKLQSVEAVNETNPDSVGKNDWSWKPIYHIADVNDNQVPAGEITITNEIIKGQISITKALDLDGANPGDEAFADKEFTFNVYAGYGVTTGEPAATLAVKADGKAVSTDELRYGMYTIVEQKAAELDKYTWSGVDYTDGADNGEPRGLLITDNTETDDVVAYVVMIQNQGETVAVTAENFYNRELDPLSVSKTVSGNRGEQDREWHFEITLTAPESYVSLDNTVWNPYQTVLTSIPDANGNKPADVSGELKLMTPIELAAQKAADAARAAFEAAQPEPAEGEEPAEFDEAAFIEEFKSSTENQALYPDNVDGKEIRVAVVTLKHGQTLTIKDLPVGVTYEVAEVEANQDSYSTTYTGEKGEVTTPVEAVTDENGSVTTPASHTTAAFVNYRNSSSSGDRTISVTVNKRWVGDAPEDRPDSITVALYNGDELSGTVTLTADGGWEYTWTKLNEKGDWRVEEVNVPEGYTSAVNGFTITNTKEEEEIPEPETPLTDIDDDETPLTDLPDMDIPENDIPLANVPEDLEDLELPEDPVPLAGVPNTGDGFGKWLAAALVSGAGLLWLGLTGKKRKDEEG